MREEPGTSSDANHRTEHGDPSFDHPELAAESWVDEHGDALFRYALVRLRDRSAAEDLVQETFLAALKGRSEFRGESQLRTWLIGILRHKIIDHQRRSSRESTAEFVDDSGDDADRAFGPTGWWVTPPGKWMVDPAQLLERQEFWDVLHRCLDGVPGKAGEAFSLRMIGDLAADDVCKVLEITPTNLWVLLHRARSRLRACLEQKWFNKAGQEET